MDAAVVRQRTRTGRAQSDVRNGARIDGVGCSRTTHCAMRGTHWLRNAQNADGGWGGGSDTPSSIEETALALHALSSAPEADSLQALERGVEWLIEATSQGTRTPVSPIGLYFARLWYFEELYPSDLRCRRRDSCSRRT